MQKQTYCTTTLFSHFDRVMFFTSAPCSVCSHCQDFHVLFFPPTWKLSLIRIKNIRISSSPIWEYFSPWISQSKIHINHRWQSTYMFNKYSDLGEGGISITCTTVEETSSYTSQIISAKNTAAARLSQVSRSTSFCYGFHFTR